ncbi:Acyl-CoA-binding domain-containing protein 4 [Capsicum chinense]|nr:Acyl-CoA-binding domain-containing protein 4 [Capsicum chinense]
MVNCATLFSQGVSETVVLNMSTLGWSIVTTVQGRVPLASKVNVLKPSHKSTLQSMETPVPDSVSAMQNATNATRDLESDIATVQEGKIREIVMDNIESEPMKVEETTERLIASVKAEKEELESSFSKEKLQTLQLKQDLTDAEGRNTDLYKELQSVRGQLASEKSRCFKLEVDVAELRQKLQALESLKKELELLQRQKAASEQALNEKRRQSSGRVWGWIAGTPPNQQDDA